MLDLADESNEGENWTDDELDAIVADYFTMLQAELARQRYVKAQHRRALMERVQRSKGSVEFKHANISAVLEELGLPTINGYKPRCNYQGAIFDAIDRYLSAHRAVLTPAPPAIVGMAEAAAIWVEETAPVADFSRPPRPERLERLVRKFDPVERDFRNRTLGEAGERRVFEMECARLMEAERADLARKVRWVSKEDGDGAGYDIASFDAGGAERLIEVKTTNGGAKTPFFITRNEKALSDERPEAFRLYRVYEFARAPRLFTLEAPLERALVLDVGTWRAGFGVEHFPVKLQAASSGVESEIEDANHCH